MADSLASKERSQLNQSLPRADFGDQILKVGGSSEEFGVQIIKRNSSQMENPLLQCDEEEDGSSAHNYSRTMLKQGIPTMPQSNEEKKREKITSVPESEDRHDNVLTAKGWTPHA